ncbi:hypothetical protein GCM10016272_02840 [Psychrobacter glaciei]|uniref:Uncharacterized protein n=1 Tax=Psychrobacter glaciei TaxID=619771 RepID=A0ABQ3GP13_9GAMM|nr:hypothetical protein GCM10016272_02840 [Psychrobacter glaciei]
MPRQPTKPTVKSLMNLNPFLPLFIALPADNNAVNDHKKQGVLADFGCFSYTNNYVHYNFTLSS